MTVHQPRSRDGRFATSSRSEAQVEDLNGQPRPESPLDPSSPLHWDPASYFGGEVAALDTGPGSFDKCKAVSAAYTDHLRSRGLKAEWVQVAGRRGSLPDADPRWGQVEQEHWQHYVTRVEDDQGHTLCVDWTNRQFEPDSPWPLVVDTDSYEDDWDGVYPIDDRALTRWCADQDRQRRRR